MSDKNIVGSARNMIQDLLAPEVKEVKAEVTATRTDLRQATETLRLHIDFLREEIKLHNEAVRKEMQRNQEALRQELKLRYEQLERLVVHGDQRNEHLISARSNKPESSIDLRERLASIEARMPRQ